MSAEISRIVIVGAGHAGGTVASLLRQYGHDGPITMIGDEPIAPYQRPPLSKAWLKGEATADSLALKPAEFYEKNGIEFVSGVSVTGIDRVAKQVSRSDGAVTPYDALILATGARAISLPVEGSGLDGVLPLRTAADAESLKSRIAQGRKLVVIGGGYIGLEVAASCRALGADVVVVERENRILARVACEELSDFFTSYHQRKGVQFELGCAVERLVGHDGKVTGVVLTDGRVIECDAVIVGIGVAPNQDLARDAGLECSNGVIVDLDARSATDPAIFAIGDVAHRPMPIYNRMFRMESVPNAIEQAKQAASAIMGRARPAGECPWQWSDQYDLKLQIAGYAFDAEEIVVRGDPATAEFAIFHLSGDRVQCVEAINAPPEFMMGRQLILSRQRVNRARLADRAVPMKEITL